MSSLLAAPERASRRGAEPLAALAGGAEAHVLDHGQARQHLGELEGAHHAEPGHLVRLHPLDRRAVERPVRPASGSSKPVIRLKNVVLPAPLGPISAVISPRWISACSTSTATSPPKRAATAVGDEDRVGLGHARAEPVRRQGDGERQRTSNACSLRSPKMPCGRKTTSSGQREPGRRCSSTCPKLFECDEPVGQLVVTGAPRSSKLSTNWITKKKMIGADDRALHPPHPAEHDDGEGEERQRGGVAARAAPTAAWAASKSPPTEPISPPRMRLCILKAKTFLPSARGGVLVLADALEHPAPRAAHQRPDEQSRTAPPDAQPRIIMNSR